MKKGLTKEINAVVKIVDEQNMTLDHCVSDDQPDRVGDDIDQKGWDFKNYQMNPVVLDGHDYSKPPVGKNLRLYVKDGQLRAVTQFAPTDEGKKYFQLYKDGFMSAFSVGFIPKEYDLNKSGGYHIQKQELLEYSVVSVPCNPRAVKSFLEDNNLLKGDNEMNKEQVQALVQKSVSNAITELNEKHVAELDAKNKEIGDLNAKVKEVGQLETKIADLEAQIKSGAKISKASAECVNGVCKGLRDHADTLEKFVKDNCAGANADAVEGDNTGKGLDGAGEIEKEYSDEDIQRLVADELERVLSEAQGGK